MSPPAADPVDLVLAEQSGPPMNDPDPTVTNPWLESRGKRLLDVTLSLALAAVAIPLIALVALAVFATSGSPVLYSQIRVGQRMRPFRVYKIRTMRRDAEDSSGPVLAVEGDPRVTPLGRALRRSRLDELPQLYNVLRGEMSLVGPRPERPLFVERFVAEVPGYAARFAAKPGLTGPAQVSGSYHDIPAHKLVHDLHYCRHASLGYDLRLLWLTVGTILRASGC